MSSDKLKQEFISRKKNILDALASGTDASPKGSVDKPIIPIMELLNDHPMAVTTSSCSGRVSVFLEGRKENLEDLTTQLPKKRNGESLAKAGGKGGDGKWLFVSHDLLTEDLLQGNNDALFLKTIFGDIPSERGPEHAVEITTGTRYVHFKFEPMILHILTETPEIANTLLICAISSSFRESGIVNPLKNPVVAIRTTGLAFDAPIGVYDPLRGVIIRLLEAPGLKMLARLANERFRENSKRIGYLTRQLTTTLKEPEIQMESKEARARRKKSEGLNKRLLASPNADTQVTESGDPLEYGITFESSDVTNQG